MKIQTFTIPVFSDSGETAALNQFLESHRIANIHREFINEGQSSHWVFCVTVADGELKAEPSKKGRIDYREVLSESNFTIFARLRSLRKQISDQEGVPPYALFTNEQLAEMVRRRVASNSTMAEITGIGPARMEKYGQSFLDELKAALESQTESNETNSR